MEDEVITPFEIGVLAALTLVGKAVALNPQLDVEVLKRDAAAVLSKLPENPQWKGGRSILRTPIEELLAGIEKVKR
ncbi:hypothetical protein [Pseudomonas ceruminis]|uniref:hypothetical protein n=1 Tax=Pseudomonas ceruminis TaxID=2740516 RepID=UPI001596A83C|nr:hypothetical protein [Pseudomonas ceruminis]